MASKKFKIFALYYFIQFFFKLSWTYLFEYKKETQVDQKLCGISIENDLNRL